MENNSTEKQITERYKSLPPEVKGLIDLGILKAVLSEIIENQNLTPQQGALLENQILLVMLFLLPQKGFGVRVQESLDIDKPLTLLISKYVQEELFDFIAEILEEADTQFALHRSSESVETPTEDTAPEANKEKESSTNPIAKKTTLSIPPEGENLEKVTPIRTMETDAKRVHGYGAYRDTNPLPRSSDKESKEEQTYISTQEDVLIHRPITETPTYTSDEDTPSTSSSK